MANLVAKEHRARRTPLGSTVRAAVVGVLWGTIAGCGAFNPAFLNVVAPNASIPLTDNARGHVVVTVVNNAEIDERLIDFLAPRLDLTEAEQRSLRPRIRMRVRVTFIDGSTQIIEYITGSSTFVDPAFDAQSSPDLNQNDLKNAVVQCDVASVDLEPGSAIEVFIPVEVTGFELVETQGDGGQTLRRFEPRTRSQPQFQVLRVDDVDTDGNTVLRRNIGIRDTVSTITNLQCGSVVAIVISGVLAVPFLDGVSDEPSFDQDDAENTAGVGGRFAFRISVQ